MSNDFAGERRKTNICKGQIRVGGVSAKHYISNGVSDLRACKKKIYICLYLSLSISTCGSPFDIHLSCKQETRGGSLFQEFLGIPNMACRRDTDTGRVGRIDGAGNWPA